MTRSQQIDQSDVYARTAPSPAPAVALRDKRCAICPRPIPAGEQHVFDGDRNRYHAECYRQVRR